MAEIWLARDHLGRVVVLTPAGLDHIRERHNELVNRMDEVRAAIVQPDFVTRDRRRAHRECFCRRALPEQGSIKVVMHYRPTSPQGAWIGEVITAYHIDRHKPKEVTLWP